MTLRVTLSQFFDSTTDLIILRTSTIHTPEHVLAFAIIAAPLCDLNSRDSTLTSTYLTSTYLVHTSYPTTTVNTSRTY